MRWVVIFWVALGALCCLSGLDRLLPSLIGVAVPVSSCNGKGQPAARRSNAQAEDGPEGCKGRREAGGQCARRSEIGAVAAPPGQLTARRGGRQGRLSVKYRL